jgi:hypothetical protein
MIFMTLVQWGLYFHASQIADAAAQDAARAAQTADGSSDAAEAAAADLLDPALRSGLLRHVHVSVRRSDRSVTVEITADVAALVPLPLDFTVRGQAGGPLETFVGEQDRP